jgi:endonuclease YncB( thermonuclease family)
VSTKPPDRARQASLEFRQHDREATPVVAAPKAGAVSRRLLLLMATLAMLLAAHRVMLASHDPAAQQATVIDGDTLQVGDQIVQLYGIDAPELGQLCDEEGGLRHCGIDAALALRKLLALARPALHCSPWQDGGDPAEAPGATIEVCEVGNQDVSLVMLHNGYSVALPGSFPDYAEAQQQAREGGLGLWHSRFALPWAWRKGERSPVAQTDCNVKAATGDAGGPAYYVPTDPGYDRIAVDPARGDAWFCSDEEARLAGWRRPGEDAAAD